MKLRIRSMATKETHRLTISDDASLSDLKTLIASTPTISSSPNPNPDSIHLSLNRSDELASQNPSDSLKELGITTGDLVFVSLSPFAPQNSISEVTKPNSEAGTSDSVKIEVSSGNFANLSELKLTQVDNRTDRSIGLMEIDTEPTETNIIERKPNLIPEFLMKLMDLGQNQDAGIINQVIRITHAALLDMGFILLDQSSSNLPPNWSSNSSSLDLKYTIPALIGPDRAFNADKIAILKFSIDGNFATIYGYFTSEFYRVCLNLGKFATLLSSNPNSMNENDQKEILEIFRFLKDGISLPLMIDLCLKNNLQLPPCFTRLSTDIKSKIFDLISGADVARAGSTCTELRTLSQDENLWKQKLQQEFPADVSATSSMTSAREKYKRAYVGRRERRERELRRESERRRRRERWTGGGFLGPARPGFGIIGGNYDRFPAIGNGSGLRMWGRQVAPRCDFGSGGDDSSRRFFDGL
ncbi:hypothetical protein LUZ60_006049 [Juncus effusus]|nr:hypothetical protein LUZ60_006049 [Juncus effusus]